MGRASDRPTLDHLRVAFQALPVCGLHGFVSEFLRMVVNQIDEPAAIGFGDQLLGDLFQNGLLIDQV